MPSSQSQSIAASEQNTQTEGGFRFQHKAWIGVILILFSLVSLAGIRTNLPQGDEAFYGNPGYNMLFNNSQGITLYQLPEYLPVSLARHALFMPPGYFYLTAFWYRVAGFGLLQIRLLSLLFSIVILLSWYTITWCLLRSPPAATVAMALISMDFFFLGGSSHGRPEMVCAGFGTAGIAAYLALRGRSPVWALFVSHVLATLAILEHPVGVLYWLCLAFIVFYFDRHLLSVKSVAAALAPCLAGMAIWGAYILQDLPGFLEQWPAALKYNANAFRDPGLSSINFVRNMQLELVHRYLGPFGLLLGVNLASRLKVLVLAAYLLGVFGILAVGRLRRRRELLALSVFAIIAISYLTFASPSKFAYYLPHVTAFMAACFGVFLFSCCPARARTWVIPGALAILGGIQVGGFLYLTRQNVYAHVYTPLIEAISRNTKPNTLIMGSPEFWFGIQPQRSLVSDPTLGYRSGIDPAQFVWDPLYVGLHELDRSVDPARYVYVENVVESAKCVYEGGPYKLFLASPESIRQARSKAASAR